MHSNVKSAEYWHQAASKRSHLVAAMKITFFPALLSAMSSDSPRLSLLRAAFLLSSNVVRCLEQSLEEIEGTQYSDLVPPTYMETPCPLVIFSLRLFVKALSKLAVLTLEDEATAATHTPSGIEGLREAKVYC